jgi:hypothetical protein
MNLFYSAAEAKLFYAGGVLGFPFRADKDWASFFVIRGRKESTYFGLM